MWEYECRLECALPPERIWPHWADIPSWPAWNPGIASIEVGGPLAVGTELVMTPPDGDPIALTIVAVEEGRSFTDAMDAGDFVVRTTHRLEPGPTGTTVLYRTEITGSAAGQVGPELGPLITADFPDVLAALVARAAGWPVDGAEG